MGLVLALVGFVLGGAVITDNSLLTHLATGELIVDRGSVPTVDPYSATAAGEPWTVQSWLASVIYAVLDRAFGAASLRVLHGVVAAGVAHGVWTLVAPTRRLVPRLALAVLPLCLGATFWSPRPLMFGLAGMVVVLHVVAGNISPRWLIPVMWLWVNTHGSFPLAGVLVTAVAVGAWLDHGRRPKREIEVLGWTALGTLLGGINPLGPSLLWFPVRLLGRREALAGVVEWTAPRFEQPIEWLYLLLLPVIVLAAARGARWRHLLPAVGFFATGLLAIRNINTAAIVVVAMAAPALRDLFGSETGDRQGPPARIVGVAAAVGLAVGTIAVAMAPGFDLAAYPVAEIDDLERRELLPADGVTLIHREGVGNYLTYRYGEAASVFIDDRFDFYPLSVTQDHLTLLDGGDYGEVLDRRGADVVLWEADSLLADWLRASAEWDVAVDNDSWLIACRRSSPIHARC